jgi:hypothetical protein
MNCQKTCGLDQACGCRCLEPMSINHAVALWQLDVCAANARPKCGLDLNCIGQVCAGFVNVCGAQ